MRDMVVGLHLAEELVVCLQAAACVVVKLNQRV